MNILPVVFLFAAAAYLFFSLYYIRYVSKLWESDFLLNGNSVETEGEVSNLRIEEMRGIAYYLTFQYEAEPKDIESKVRRFTKEQGVSRRTYEQFAKGARIFVEYMPAAPDKARISSRYSDTAIRNSILGLTGCLFFFAPYSLIVIPIIYLIKIRQFEHYVYDPDKKKKRG